MMAESKLIEAIDYTDRQPWFEFRTDGESADNKMLADKSSQNSVRTTNSDWAISTWHVKASNNHVALKSYDFKATHC